jgi:hypothetical protein
MSRKPHEPTAATRKLVRTLAGVGQDQDDIARQVGISPKTLRLHYRDELDEGHTEAVAAVIGKLYEMIQDGNSKAAIFADKCRGGKRDEAPPKPPPKETNRFTDPRWVAYWNHRAAETRDLWQCDAARCAEGIKNRILYELGVAWITHLDDERLRYVIAQVEALIKTSEEEVETLVPYYEVWCEKD